MANFPIISVTLPFLILLLSIYLELPERFLLPTIRRTLGRYSSSEVTAYDDSLNLTYIGVSRDGVDTFHNVFYAQDTAGSNRFAPPVRFTPTRGSVIDATAPGAMCPQAKGDAIFPFTSPTVNISENCLSLKIVRPENLDSTSRMPVIVYLHGGGAIFGSGQDQAYNPDGLVRNSVARGQPVVVVLVNYRLGIFGFAAMDALRRAKHMNLGLRDQRMALEWVKDHIRNFGGDASSVTLAGQSVGAAHTSLHITSYSGKKALPFHRAMLMSGASGLNFNIDSDFVVKNTASVAKSLGCITDDSGTGSGSDAVLQCLKRIPLDSLNDASIKLARSIHPPFGELSFYPSLDNDYIPKRPSVLLREGKFAEGIPVLASWTTNDGAWYTQPTIEGDEAIGASYAAYAVNIKPTTLQRLLDHYPASSFKHLAEAWPSTTVDYWRAAQLHRDAWFVCPVIAFTWQLAKHGNPNIHLYEINATRFASAYKATGVEHWKVAHMAEIPYVFNNDIPGSSIAIDNSREQKQLARALSASVIAFAYSGDPSKTNLGSGSLGDWPVAYGGLDNKGLKKEFPEMLTLQVVGGPYGNGPAVVSKEGKKTASDREMAVEWEDLFTRCAYIDSIADEIGV